VVLVVEPRVAIALLEGSRAAVSSDGAVFVPPEPLEPGLPTARGDGVGLVTAMRVLETIPADLRSRVALVSATTRDDAELVLDSGIVIRWGSAERPLLKARVLAALMKTKARVYDVAAPELPTTIGQPIPPAG
jgi:cell division protein FtsQ